MSYKKLLALKEAANEQLAAKGASYRVAFMTQNKHTRITINIGTEEQIKAGTARNSLAVYLTVNEAILWMWGWQAYSAMQTAFEAPVK